MPFVGTIRDWIDSFFNFEISLAGLGLVLVSTFTVILMCWERQQKAVLRHDVMAVQSASEDRQETSDEALAPAKGGHQDVAICHSEPGAWHVPTPSWPSSPCPRPRKRGAGPYYVVGRTMFETDRLPAGWPARCQWWARARRRGLAMAGWPRAAP